MPEETWDAGRLPNLMKATLSSRGVSSSTHLGGTAGALQLGEYIQQIALVVHLQHPAAQYVVASYTHVFICCVPII